MNGAMELSLILDALNDFAPLSYQEDWDNSGLLYGNPEMEIKGVLIGFDCTEELIREAVSMGANLVITHHPLIFKGIRKVVSGDP